MTRKRQNCLEIDRILAGGLPLSPSRDPLRARPQFLVLVVHSVIQLFLRIQYVQEDRNLSMTVT